MKKNNFVTSKKLLFKMQVVHFGKILFNLQMLPFAIMVTSIASFIVPVVYYIMLIAISLFTFFSIYAVYPEFSSWWSGGEVLAKVAEQLAQSWKYTVPIVLALSLLSIVCLSIDANKKHTTRIVVSVIVAVLSIAILALKFINAR